MANNSLNTFEISLDISSGKKDFTVTAENDAFTLHEAGSIVAVLKFKDDRWCFSKGSYSEDDAQKIGATITKILHP